MNLRQRQSHEKGAHRKLYKRRLHRRPPHQKSNKGLFGLSEVFECLSEKKPPYKRQIVYLVYPQVYVLPLIGGYKSTTKTIARKRVTQKALDRKKSNKELFGFCECRLILELPARYVGIHICGSFEVFECLSGKKSPPIIGKSYTPKYTFYLL